MKQRLILFVIILLGVNLSYSQMTCDSLHFYSDTVYINQSVDTDVTIDYYYNNDIIPEVFYPAYTITLDDTTDIVFREFLATSIIALSNTFTITYKNTAIPIGTEVIGTFNIGTALECSYPVVFIFDESLAVDDIELNESLAIYPNPSSSQLNIEVDGNIISTTVVDAMGNVLEVSLTSKTIDVSALANGVYVLQVETDKGIGHKKFVKE